MLSDIISNLLHWIEGLGYFGIMLGLMVEVIPSEIVLAYAGYLVSQGHINFVGAVIFGTIGALIAQIFLYWIGRYGGRPVLDRYGKYIFMTKKHIDASEAWFLKYGSGMVFFARFVPVARQAISIPAGLAKMKLSKFILLTTLASIPWSILFIYLGKALGENWEDIDKKAEPYAMPLLLAALALLIAYFLIKWIFSNKKKKGA